MKEPIVKDLVLIGGGHSHAIALRQLGMNPLPGVRLTLITDVFHTPYSGMLPGYIAGLYDFDDCHIDLRPLAQWVGATMIVDRAIGLDLTQQRVLLANHPPIAFDQLSIDIGSTPATLTIPDASDQVIPVKPISKFLSYWQVLVDDVARTPTRPLKLGVVGGGAGGVELALSMQSHLQRIYQAAGQVPSKLEIHLFHRGNRLLPERHPWVGHRLQRILERRGVQLHLQETVSAVEKGSAKGNWKTQGTTILRCESGLEVRCDRLFWVTQASAASWLAESGLATNQQGFIQVNDCLQSISHPHVFAAGDVATMVNHPRPKAGVFAVRQGQPLVQNLRRALLDQPLKPFCPQKEFLILVSTGEKAAIASRGSFHLGPAPWIWHWKDYIDRKFMAKFSDLQPMTQEDIQDSRSSLSLERSPMPCAGCASKVGSTVLQRVLTRLKQETTYWPDRDDILLGLEAPDDAAVVQVPAGQVMVQTVDYFRALIDDPFLFGQISTLHCLSDLFAMGATPQSAMAIATLPYGTEPKVEETLYQLLSGALKALSQTQAVLIGGHTTEGTDLAFGLSCNGLAHPDRLLRKGGMKPGQVLILTKALGTGILFAADMRLKAKGRWIDQAIQSMLISNQAAANCFQHYEATACTDITGFGLMGHLLEMVQASQVAVELDLSPIPHLEGVPDTLQLGITSSLYPANLKAAQFIQNRADIQHLPLFPLLFDPQTSGGLLASVPEEQAIACLYDLKIKGYPHSSIIGRTLPLQDSLQPIRVKG